MDAITALSGSGPAYYALLAEAMIEAGILLGLSREISTKLVVQTMLGTARLLRDEAYPGRVARWSPRPAAPPSAPSASSNTPACAEHSSTPSTPPWSARKNSRAAAIGLEPRLIPVVDIVRPRAVAGLLADAARRGRAIAPHGRDDAGLARVRDRRHARAELEPRLGLVERRALRAAQHTTSARTSSLAKEHSPRRPARPPAGGAPDPRRAPVRPEAARRVRASSSTAS